jgi:hypothetical protein
MSRHDLRELVKRGLATTCGNYRAVVPLFGMLDGDYKRFLNFLATHDCCVDFREFRTGKAHTPPPRTTLVPMDGQFDPNHGRAADGVSAGSRFEPLLPAATAGRSREPRS